MPKTREQNEEIKNKRIKTILETALYFFAFEGYQAIKIDDITKKAKCSHGLFYHYFQTKDELFQATMDMVRKELSIYIGTVNLSQKAKFALHDFLSKIVDILNSKNDLTVCMIYLILNLHLQKDVIPKPPKGIEHHQIFDVVYELIKNGQNDNDFIKSNTKELTIAILSMIKGLSYNRLNLGNKKFVCPSAEIMMNLLINKGGNRYVEKN